jgi:hypothetical protein
LARMEGRFFGAVGAFVWLASIFSQNNSVWRYHDYSSTRR